MVPDQKSCEVKVTISDGFNASLPTSVSIEAVLKYRDGSGQCFKVQRMLMLKYLLFLVV
jgi:hypothetical protein